jgi:hypothetical protein
MALKRYFPSNLLAFFLALLSIWGIITSYQYGAASLDYYKIRSILAIWQEEGVTQSPEQYQQAKQTVSDAHKSHPSHPMYIDLIGQINEWGVIAGYVDKEQALALAKKSYLDATQLRPTWPVTWASLAMVKWRLQEFDDELLLYLNRADKFGPRKPEVNLLYSELGLALYKANHPFILRIRPQVQQRLARGLSDAASRKRVVALIVQYDAAKIACRWLRDESNNIRKFIPACKL